MARAALLRDDCEVVAINDPFIEPDYMACVPPSGIPFLAIQTAKDVMAKPAASMLLLSQSSSFSCTILKLLLTCCGGYAGT